MYAGFKRGNEIDSYWITYVYWFTETMNQIQRTTWVFLSAGESLAALITGNASNKIEKFGLF